MAAMLVMDMVIVMMTVVVMVVAMVVVMRRHCGSGCAACSARMNPAALGPDQPGAEGGDQGVACDLDRLLGPAHGPGGRVEQPGADRDDHDRDQRLHQRRGKRQHDAARAVSWLATR